MLHGPAGRIATRLYDARVERAPGPAMLFLRGGGLAAGKLDNHEAYCVTDARLWNVTNI